MLFTDMQKTETMRSDSEDEVPPVELYRALLEGDESFVDAFASNMPPETLERILNARISWSDTKDTSPLTFANGWLTADTGSGKGIALDDFRVSCTFDKDTMFCLPLSLAAISGNKELVGKLLRLGAKLHGTDSTGRNVIHDLVYWSEKQPEAAVSMYGYFMDSVCSAEDRETLLKSEDQDGRNCLDLASEKFLPEMILAVLNTEGVYKHVVKDCLLHRHIYYDISEYESLNCKKLSPLAFLQNLTNSEVIRFDACNFFRTPLVETWIEKTYQSNFLNIFVWIAMWLFHLGLFVVVSVLHLNKRDAHDSLFYCLGVVAIFGVLLEHVSSRKNWRRWQAALLRFLKFGRVPATLTVMYRMIHVIFSYMCIALCIVELMDLDCQYNDELHALYLFAGSLGVLSLLYFVTLVTSVGHLLVILLKMIYDTGSFLLVAIVFYAVSTNAFYALSFWPANCENESEANANASFPVHVSRSYTDFMFETFLLITSIKSPDEDFFQQSTSAAIGQMVYSGSIIVFSVILLNMLIGVMSQRITEIEEHKNTLLKLEKLSVTLFLTDSFLHKFRYHSGIAQRFFKVSTDCTKVYVEVTEPYAGGSLKLERPTPSKE